MVVGRFGELSKDFIKLRDYISRQRAYAYNVLGYNPIALVRSCSSRTTGGITQAACPAPLCGRLVWVVYYE